MKKLMIIVLGVVVILLLLPETKKSDTSDKNEPDIGAIKSQAERFVKENLKSPTTADFGGMFEYPEMSQHKDDPTIFFVFGKVTAQNSFGAELTQEYAVKMQKLCDEEYKRSCWKALNVAIGE